jgi:hypothetical protein
VRGAAFELAPSRYSSAIPAPVSLSTTPISARIDLHDYFEKIARDDGDYAHTLLKVRIPQPLAGPHWTSEVIPIAGGRSDFGTWGIFLFEHRRASHSWAVMSRLAFKELRAQSHFTQKPPPAFSAQEVSFVELILI